MLKSSTLLSYVIHDAMSELRTNYQYHKENVRLFEFHHDNYHQCRHEEHFIKQ